MLRRLPHRPSTWLLAVGALLTACQGPTSSAPEAARPLCEDCNVLLISIDTLRADHLSVYGYERPTTPFLEELAAEAVVFDDMVNNGGATLPSHMTMMTSLPVGVHKVTRASRRVLEPERITLAEQLSAGGLRTAAFTDAGLVRGKYGFAQGFEVFDDAGGRFVTILPKARAWLKETRPERFFLFLHTYDTHSQGSDQPYDCPGEYPYLYTAGIDSDFTGCSGDRCASELLQWLNKQIRSGREDFRLADYLDPADIRLIEARYDGCINYVDDQLRGLIEWSKQEGLYENTLILITSDHGEEFLDHGRFLHRNTRFEELVNIPLLVKFPHSSFAGERVPYLGAMLDLMPTILDVLGIEPNPQVTGVSLLPTLTGRRPVRDSTLIFSAVRTDRWKYLRTPDEQLLFDLQEDPGELSNVLADHPDLVSQLAAESARGTEENRRRRQAFQAGREEQEPLQLTREEIEELEALGYID